MAIRYLFTIFTVVKTLIIMLKQPTLPLYNSIAIYEKLVPKSNLLRKMNDLLDFSFVYDELSNKYCKNNGRTSEDPIKLFKYLLLKCLFHLSDVDVVEQSQYDLSFRYFLGMDLEEGLINPSTLTKFRKLRLNDSNLLDLLISKTVQLGVEKGVIKSTSIIVDSTHTKSRYNLLNPIEELRKRSKDLRKTIYEINQEYTDRMPEKNKSNNILEEIEYTKELLAVINNDESLSVYQSVIKKFNYLEEVVADYTESGILSGDRDAKIGHKDSESSFLGFKTHLAINQEGLITAAIVTSGEKGDCPELLKLIAKTEEAGIKVKEVIGDGAYSSSAIIKDFNSRDIKLISKINPTALSCEGLGINDFTYNKDSKMLVCKAGHQAREKGMIRKKNYKEESYYFNEVYCVTCKFKNECYLSGGPKKSKVIILSKDRVKDLYPEQVIFQQTKEFKTKYKTRYKVEAKNADLKNNLGYDKAISKGISGMQIQGAVTIFAANMRRIVRLLDPKVDQKDK